MNVGSGSRHNDQRSKMNERRSQRERASSKSPNEPLRFSEEAIRIVNDGRVKKRLSRERRYARTILSRVGDQLRAKDGVSDVCVGLHLTDGTYTLPPRIAIRVYVDHKKLISELPSEHAAIEKSIEGVPVNVIEQCYRSCAADEAKRRRDPLKGGVAIAQAATRKNWGTLGMVVYKNGHPHYLTNSHVTPDREAPVIQPPLKKTKDALIGHVKLPVRNSHVDCAIIAPSGDRDFEDGILGLPGDFADDEPLTRDDEGAEIIIAGAASGYPLAGIVFDVYRSVNLKDLGNFTKQMILVRSDGGTMVKGGDSGAIVVRKRKDESDPYQVVGLVIGEAIDRRGNHIGAVANHFRKVKGKRALGIELQPQ